MDSNKLILSLVIFAAWTSSAFGQPVITSQPANKSVSLGANVSFRVTATTTNPPLSFQWRFNTTELGGQTTNLIILTNIQTTNAGGYDVVVSDMSSSVTSLVATLTVDPTFTKITTGAIVTDLALSIRGAWGDYDDDGYLDLFVTSSSGNKNYLYHNDRNGTFSRVTTGEIVNTARDWRTGAWGDYDNDGHIDLFVTSSGFYGPISPWNYLYWNNGDGTFTSIPTNIVGDLVGPNGVSETCAWADYDRDGFLDMFVSRYSNDLLFHNNGNGSFTRITNSPLVLDGRNNYGCAWGDYDNDGWPDLFMSAADFGGNFLYRNIGDGTFERITSGSIAKDSSALPVGVLWVDYNNDGFLDLFVCDAGNTPNLLYRNEGNGTFTKITSGDLITRLGFHPNAAWGDYDNDGYVDVFLAVRENQDNLLYRNNGDGTFARVTTGSPVHDGGDSVNPAWADYDNDGFIDLFVANGAAATPQNNFLYHNNGNTNHWLKLRLIGSVSNRSAIGAKVRMKAKIHGLDMWQLREITGSNTGSSLIAHFGLGDASQADFVRIEWPSGTVTELHDVAAKQLLTVIEPPRLKLLGQLQDDSIQVSLTGGIGLSYDLETSSDLAQWTPWITLTNSSRTMTIADGTATNFAQRFYRAVAR